MEKISDVLRQGLLALLDPMTEASRDALLPAVIEALAGIERRCPMSILSTPDGAEMAYGPNGMEDGEFLIVAATPKGCMTAAATDLAKGKSGADLPLAWKSGAAVPLGWESIIHCIEENKVRDLLRIVVRRLGTDGVETVNGKFAEYRELGFTPALLVIGADRGDKVCGVVGTFPLPGRHEAQIAAAQEASTY